MTYLLDANVVFALVWSLHEHHVRAHAWMDNLGEQRWATNPLIDLAVLRLLLNPKITQGVFSAKSAHAVVMGLQSHPRYEGWCLPGSLAEKLAPLVHKIRGHQQWNDAALLADTVDRKGVLVTFDNGFVDLAGSAWAEHVQVLASRATLP